MLCPPGSNESTWYHFTGGPTQQMGYTLQMQGGKRLNSFGTASRTFVCTIPASETNKVKAAAKAVPLQRCQRWTVALLGRLEQKGLVPPDTSAEWESRVEISPHEQQQNPGSSQYAT